MALSDNPFYTPRNFQNLVTTIRPPRDRDVKSGGTHQGDGETLGTSVVCSIQQETDNPMAASMPPARGAITKARIYFPIDPDAPMTPLRYQDRIRDERAGGFTYVVDEFFDVAGTGEVYQARVTRAG